MGSSNEMEQVDLIDRQAAIDALRKMQTYKLFAGDDMILVDKAQAQTELMMLPSVQPETTRILAETLNGSPLLYPCDKLWSREGWCKDHCKKGQAEPDTECWLKYAETIAAERREE